MDNRTAKIARKTGETDIKIELKLDGRGENDINTGIKMFDHLLTQVAVHGRFDLSISAAGDDQHHLIEDVAICLGKAIGEALGEKRGIVRMGDATVPMDDALATVVVDLSGRGYSVLELPLSSGSEKGQLLGFPPELIRHFLESLAIEGRMNLHARIVHGQDDHHKAEAVFKALGRALDQAVRVDPRIAGDIPSSKKSLEH